MKFSCLQENLNKGIQTVTRAIPTKSALPILSNILISAEKNKLKLAATNMETTIVTHVGASVDEEGSITVPAKIFKEFIANLSPSTVNAKVENDVLHITSDKTKSKFNGTSSEDYPELPEIDKKRDFIEFDPKQFNDAISMVAFASGNDNSRPIFTGILVKGTGNKITFASSDGFRLSEKSLKISKDYPDFSVVIPAKTLVEVAKIFSGAEESLKFAVNEDENLAVFYAEDTYVATRILEGEYPDYVKIIPTDSIINVVFPAEEFSEAVKLTNIFTNDSDAAIRIKFDPDGFLKIASLTEGMGEHESQVSAEVDGEVIEITFNPRYLIDFLNNIKSEKIHFASNGNVSPCLLKVEEHEEFLHIIMPIMKS